MHYMIENLTRYRNLWWAEYHVIAGENIFNTLYRQILDITKRNRELKAENDTLKQEILKLSQRGEN